MIVLHTRHYNYVMCAILAGHAMMSDKHKEILTRHFQKNVDNLIAESILPILVSEKIITVGEIEQIRKGNATTKDKATELVTLLTKKEDRTFYVLIAACKEEGMLNLARLLEDAGIHHTHVLVLGKCSECLT